MFDTLRSSFAHRTFRSRSQTKLSPPSRRPRSYAQAAAVAIESLESRTFLSATISVSASVTVQSKTTVVAIANGSVTASRANYTDFGFIDAPSAASQGNLANAGGSVYRTYTIKNIGNSALTVTTPTITGPGAADFQVTTVPAPNPIAAGSYTTFVVTFTPHAQSFSSAVVHIASNDPAHPSYNFTVQGIGLDIYVFTDSGGTATGLKAQITQSGTGTLATLNGERIRMTYDGYLTDDTLFDSSTLHPPGTFDFTLGAGQVIQGWDQGLQNMHIGEKRLLIIPPSLGYGNTANGSIPANSTLIFEVQLKAILGPTIQVAGRKILIPNGAAPSVSNGTGFDAVYPNTTVTHTFKITAAAAGSLSFTGNPEVQLSGTNANLFSITQPVIDSSGTFATFTVTYAPTAVGPATAIITIPNNDPLNQNYHFTVSGTGRLSPSDLAGYFPNSINLPVNIGNGDTLSVPITLTNSGPSLANGTVQITIKASTDGTWHDTDPTLGTVASQAINIAVNGTGTYNIPITIPPASSLVSGATVLPTGGYFLVAQITPVSGITQDGGQHNTITGKGAIAGPAVPLNIVVPKPDLTVSFGNLTPNFANYVPGDTITLPVIIRNIGVRPAVGTALTPIKIDVRSSTNNAYDVSDPLITQLSIPYAIARGASVTQMVTFKIPASITPGSVYAVANVDSTSVVAELDETNNTAATAGSINILWRFGAVAGRTGSVPLTLKDSGGTQVTLQLTGPGTGTLTSDGSGGFNVTLTGTTTATTFNINTLKTTTPGDDGRFTLDNLTVGDPLNINDHTSIGTINARTTDLAGNIAITGAASALNWGNIAGQHVISIGSPAILPPIPPAVSFTFGTVQNLTLNSALGISSLTATDWQSTTALDSLTAPWLASLKITGDTLHGRAGDFMANLDLTAASGQSATLPTLGTAAIAGSVGANNWNIAGKIGTVTIGGTLGTFATAWNVSNFTGATSFTLGDVINADISTAGDIGTMAVKRWQAGSLDARSLNMLQVPGKTGSFAGDFNADLTLAGAVKPTLATLGSATIGGLVGATTWDVTGKVGTVSIAGAVGTAPTAWQLSNLTSATSITLGDVTNASIDASGAIGTLSSKRWLAGDITAASINMLSTTGQTGLSPFAGDFAANLTLTGPGTTAAAPVLGTATFANHITGGTWNIAGAVTSLTAKAIEALWQGNFTGASGNIATMNLSDAASNSTVDLTANAIGTLTVAGGLANSTLTLNQGVSLTRAALGSLSVGHDITASAIRAAGNIGTVRVRSLASTLLFAGVQPSLTILPASAADFVNLVAASLPTIASLTLTGFPLVPATPVFANSDVAAGKITTVLFPSINGALVNQAGALSNFGFATRLGVTTYTGPVSSGLYISPRNSIVN
jgi:hypothetical protein